MYERPLMEEPLREEPSSLPRDLLGALSILPPDVLQTNIWGLLPPSSRTAFRQTCIEADALARRSLITSATVLFNHHYLEALGFTGRSLVQHFPGLRALTLRQATAGRKPLPAEVVRACLELLTRSSGGAGGAREEGGAASVAAGGLGAAAAGTCGAVHVRQLALQDWPSLEVGELVLLAAAFPRLEGLGLACRTRAFPHHYPAPDELLPLLARLLPRLSRLELTGLGLQAAAGGAQHQPQVLQPQRQHQAEGGPMEEGGKEQGERPPDSAGGSSDIGGNHRHGDDVSNGCSSNGLAVLAELLPGLQSLTLRTIDLPPSLCSQLGCLTQLRELSLECGFVMTPADEVRPALRTMGRSLAALLPLLERLTLRVTSCVEDYEGADDEEEVGEEEGVRRRGWEA
ncbi:hypothetical protein Agub_g8543, partial [Astrephomene gubernaculifera]